MASPQPGQNNSLSDTADSASEQLYTLHASAILAYVRLHVASQEAVEDIVIDVFLAALEQTFLLTRNVETQRAWLRKTAYHKIVDYYRRQGRRQHVRLEDVAETLYTDEMLSPEQSALLNERYQQVADIVRRLPVFQQQIVRLRVVYGLRSAEIASVLGKNESTVRTALARALNTVRTLYETE